jgi:hypothetical protein
MKYLPLNVKQSIMNIALGELFILNMITRKIGYRRDKE